MSLQFVVDDRGAVIGVEERWHRGRRILPRVTEPAAPINSRPNL
jgi:hypothetical protein